MAKAATLGELRKAGIRTVPVKEELRRNLVRMMKEGGDLFPGIVGYERTVIPDLQNAILARHDFILLGLRGQAKSRILRSLVRFLDEEIPYVAGCPIHDDPYRPTCKRCRRLAAERGDALEVAWLGREERYREKLATPDVTMADLIGDIDPIKAANERLSLSDEEVIHYGLIPRTNRGIFAVNELPDLHARIQVGLLNILEERDVQIRGFPVRLPLDICLVFSANPEDYTNRGSIITPLKDRVDSQIMTHYPARLEDAMAITAQEAWIEREGCRVGIPALIREIVEEIAFQARKSEFVDQSSGVSARVPISAMECLISNVERRALATGAKETAARVCDIYAAVPAITGKIELVYEGEQEGISAVARRIIGQAVQAAFQRRFPDAYERREKRRGKGRPRREPEPVGSQDLPDDDSPYKPVLDWFAAGNVVEITDRMDDGRYREALEGVAGLSDLVREHLKPADEAELALGMEFLLDGLHQCSLVAREDLESGVSYRDMLKQMFESMR